MERFLEPDPNFNVRDHIERVFRFIEMCALFSLLQAVLPLTTTWRVLIFVPLILLIIHYAMVSLRAWAGGMGDRIPVLARTYARLRSTILGTLLNFVLFVLVVAAVGGIIYTLTEAISLTIGPNR